MERVERCSIRIRENLLKCLGGNPIRAIIGALSIDEAFRLACGTTMVQWLGFGI
jgi:hypothetical protein